MPNDVIEKLKELNLELPEISTPGGNYQSVNIRGKIVYVAIQFPIYNGNFLYKGRLGLEINSQDGYNALQLCALNVLAQINSKVGFEKIVGLNHIDVYYRAVQNWHDSPKIADGASNLFANVLGAKGQHSRGLMGVENFPGNFSVGLITTWTLI